MITMLLTPPLRLPNLQRAFLSQANIQAQTMLSRCNFVRPLEK